MASEKRVVRQKKGERGRVRQGWAVRGSAYRSGQSSNVCQYFSDNSSRMLGNCLAIYIARDSPEWTQRGTVASSGRARCKLQFSCLASLLEATGQIENLLISSIKKMLLPNNFINIFHSCGGAAEFVAGPEKNIYHARDNNETS